jgi:hypothetical protein
MAASLFLMKMSVWLVRTELVRWRNFHVGETRQKARGKVCLYRVQGKTLHKLRLVNAFAPANGWRLQPLC